MPTSVIAGFDDWPGFIAERPLVQADAIASRASSLLSVPAPMDPHPQLVSTTQVMGVQISEYAWDTGFGPRLHAWLVVPEGARPHELPGVLNAHSHGGIKSVGALRQLPLGDDARLAAYREHYEDDSFFPVRLAHAGFTVLCPDAFSWGSRRFRLDPLPERLASLEPLSHGLDAESRYDLMAGWHEHLIARYAIALGTSYAGMVAHDDLSALTVLRQICAPGPVGIAGFSGGGGRAGALASLDADPHAVAITAMMTTPQGLVPDHIDAHSWLMHTPGLPALGGLVDLVTSRPESPLLVQYGSDDPLFSRDGMAQADELLGEALGMHYQGSWYPIQHRFSIAEQDEVIGFFADQLRSNS